MAIFTKILQKIKLWHCLWIILSTIVLRGNRHLKEPLKQFWDNIMEKKNFFIVSQKLSANLPNWQKCDKKWLNSAVKKNNYPQKTHPMTCRNFYIEVDMTIKYENKFFLSKTLLRIDVFSSINLEYTIKNKRPVKSYKKYEKYDYFSLILNFTPPLL